MPQSVAQYQQSLEDFVLSQPPRRRFWLGLFTGAALAHFVPVVVCAILGQWTNTVMVFSFLAVSILFLMMINLLGNKIKHIWLVNGLAAFALEVVAVQDMRHQHNNLLQGLAAWWTTLAWLAASFSLNAALFLYYKRIAELP